jgi:PST family polysaccharide transporter
VRSLIGRVAKIFKHKIVENILALSGLHILNYVFPIVTVPYLTRVLGPAAWGLVAFYQGFASFIVYFVEFGFNWSSTREIARLRDSPRSLADIMSGVLGAKSLLSVVGVAVALLAYLFVPPLQADTALIVMSVVWALGQAFNMIWFFQGLERMRVVALLTTAAKVVTTIAIFIVVRSPSDAWKVMALQASAAWFAVGTAAFIAYKGVPFRRPNMALTIHALRTSWSLFLFNSSRSLYTVGNAFILGLFASSRVVGFYAAAEKLIRVLLGLLNPISRAIYPRVSYLVHHSPERALRLVRLTFLGMTGFGALISLAVAVFAPLIVRVALGADFGPAIPILRVSSLLPFIVAPSIVLGTHWMLPLGHDRPYLKMVFLAGLVNVALAVALAPTFAGVGMAWAVVSTETFVTLIVYWWLKRRMLDPLGGTAALDQLVLAGRFHDPAVGPESGSAASERVTGGDD